MVILHHTEQIKGLFGIDNHYTDNLYGVTLGSLGVTLFFCLSGFLITYLLLAERTDSGTISIRNFYVRRVLRIWPLYFLIVFLAFAVLNRIDFLLIPGLHEAADSNYWTLLAYYLTFTPNFLVFAVMPYASQCWSIGVEEQFYAIWPMVMKFAKNSVVLISAIVVIFIGLNFFVDFLLPQLVSDNTYYAARVILTGSRFDCMAIGAIFAHILYRHNNGKFVSFLYRKDVQLITYLTAFYLMYKMPIFRGVGHLLYAVVFSIIILNLSANKRTIINLEKPVFDYLGKISYGLYMFHPIVIVPCIKIFFLKREALGLHSLWQFNLCLYPVVVIMTIIISALSYYCYEKKFLLLKNAFSTLISGDNARDGVIVPENRRGPVSKEVPPV